jgi:N-acetylglucosamine transport system permease protein
MTTTQTAEPTTAGSLQPAERAKVGAGEKTTAGVAHAVLIFWSIVVIAPMLWALLSSFKTSQEIFASPFAPPAKFQLINYVHAWKQAGIGRAFFNTIAVVGVAMVVVMILGAMCAYVLSRFQFFGRRAIYYLMLAGLTFPPMLAIVPLFFVLKNFGMLNTLGGLTVTYVAFALPFTMFFLYSFFKSLPYEVAEAAAIDGAGEWKTFFLVMLPMARPGMASIAIFNFLGLWNQYLLPIALNTTRSNWVLAQAVASFASQAGYRTDFGMLFAAVIITILPVLVMYVIFQRQLQSSVTAGSLK